MCEYCGCKQVPAVRARMDEHAELDARIAAPNPESAD